jgi:hypothetical protein
MMSTQATTRLATLKVDVRKVETAVEVKEEQ